MPQLYKDPGRCFGCAACEAACPSKAVEMKRDAQGFQYPLVNAELCSECGLCASVCPALNPLPSAKPQFYAVKANDGDLLEKSTSGGAFSLIASSVLEKGGLVCGAVFGEGLRVVHVLSDDIGPMRKSKYVQSDVSACYKEIEKALAEGRTVAFSGTPCQCHGMKLSFPKAEGLILISLVCRSVMSPKFWSDYTAYLEKKHGKLSSFCFRDRDEEGGSYCVSFTAEDGEHRSSFLTDPFCRIYAAGLASRPSCFSCPYTRKDKDFDFVIGDLRGDAEKLPPDSGKGWSMAAVSGEKAAEIIKSLESRARVIELSEDAVNQPSLSQPPKEGLLRRLFAKDLSAEGPEGPDMERILKKYRF